MGTTKAVAGLGALVLGAGLLFALAPATQATPSVHVSCGQIITTDTKLANDLVDCPRHGIIIGADDVTLDLNGHTVDGDGTPFENCPADEPCDVGIVNSAIRNGTPFNGPGFDDVTIKNGSVQEFAEGGVYVVGARHVAVRHLKTSQSDFTSDGVHLHDCTHCLIADSSGGDYGAGFVVARSRDVLIARSVVSDNRFAGILVAESDHVRVVGSTVTGTADGDGISLIDTRDSVVRNNALFGNAAGVGIAESDHNLVTRNVLRDNHFVGAYVYGGDSNRIAHNRITANSDGAEGGIHLLATEEGDGADHNRLIANRLSRNVGDGILVDAGQTGTVISRNVARRNTDDGIDVASPSTTLSRNWLVRNGDLGIDAVPGVTDGGRNRASGNGNAAQCVNVLCS